MTGRAKAAKQFFAMVSGQEENENTAGVMPDASVQILNSPDLSGLDPNVSNDQSESRDDRIALSTKPSQRKLSKSPTNRAKIEEERNLLMQVVGSQSLNYRNRTVTKM